MFLTDDESGELKKWVVKKLEDISDADSDVLADYVLALIRADTPDEDLKKNAIENLEDFLRDNTAGFVDEIFTTINERSYMPGYVPPPSTHLRPTAFDTVSSPADEFYSPLDARRGLNGALNMPRKRSYNDRLGDGDGNDLQYGRNDRSIKQMRRGGRGGRGDGTRGDYNGGRGGRVGGTIEQYPSAHGIPGLAQSPPIPFPGMPAPPPGFPFDPNDPMGAFMAMQAMGFPPLPGLPTFPQGATPTGLQPLGNQLSPGTEASRVRKPGVRCSDYDTKGFCTRGSSCPYEHGMDHIVVPGQQDEYDPKNSVMVDVRKPAEDTNGNGFMNGNRGSDRGRGRGRGRGDGGASSASRRGRADFSHAGPNHDRSISTIVVEQIPEERFDETSVREFFSQFGNILEVTMQPYKRLAIVKYDDYGAAKRAYESPKVIFENRFVKVYWYKPDALPTPPTNQAAKAAFPSSPTSKSEEKPFDKVQFERDSAAAQKRLEEKQKKLKETELQRQALERQKEELAKMQQEEKKKLLEKLAAKGAGKADLHADSVTAENGTTGTGDKKASAQTEALRAQLAALEAEARSLGLDTTLTDESSSYRGRGRGRGIYRGWGSFSPRGRGFDSSRGAYRSRGAPFGARGGGVYKLDNRTKKVAVSGVTFDSAKDEGLRQYLLGIGEFENIEANPDRRDSQVITFKDRFTAEKLLYGSTEIPSVGKVEFAWVNTPLPPVTPTVKSHEGDTHMADNDAGSALADGARTADVDYDVAEDDDRWMAEYTASFAFFEAIWEAGITHCFVNLGSDHPSIIEAMVKGQNEKQGQFPKIITCPNEMVALSMADGYARLTNQPQCVIVHVDVGTQGLGAAVHNASCGRAPVLIFAGLSPFTIEGEMRGSRTEYIHWIQDVPDQKQIVAQYCRYTGEIKTGKNVKQMVNRALSFAMSDPKGPVYLYGAREAMEEDLEPYHLEQAHWRPIEPAALPEHAVKQIAEVLVEAKEPLVITGYSGRNHASVPELVKLTETIKGLRVLDTGGSDMCFPADHRASLGVRYGVDDSIKSADVILVVDCDVPWINTQCHPKKDAKIFHIDIDPLKQQMPVFYIAAMARYRADSYTSFKQLHTYIDNTKSLCDKATSYTDRWEKLGTQHQQRLSTITELAQPGSDGTYNISYLTASVRKAVPKDTIFCIEAVTNTAFVADQIQASLPGSWINCGGGGLGWSGGAALGVKMATDAAGEKKFVCQIVGDGTFLFSVPGSVYWIAQRYKIPTLTIILNNQGWNAPRRSLLLVHPNGAASKVTNEELNISFAPTPDYAGIAKAAAGGNLWAGRAGTVEELGRLLPEAVQSVLNGKGAVLDAHLDGPQGKFGGGVGGTSG